MSLEGQNQPSLQSLRFSKSPHGLRKDFLNNSVQQSFNSKSANIEHSNSSQQQQDFESSSQNAQNQSMNKSNKIWECFQSNMLPKNKKKMHHNQKYIENNLTPLNQQQRKQLKTSQSKKLQGNFNTDLTSLQYLNYKRLLKKQIEKSNKLQETIHKQDSRVSHMAKLIEKLQQQNNLLRKMLQKQKNKNFSALKSIHSCKSINYCECQKATNPTSIGINNTTSKYFRKT